jgi:bis(5'-nucleosidyl)-tetraphosphatase
MRTISCGVVIVRKENDEYKYLLLRSYSFYDSPKGRQENDETDLETALREVWEETGIGSKDLNFKWGRDCKETEPYARNKVARYFVAETTKTDIDLKVNPEIGKPEHDSYEWLTYEEASRKVGARVQKILDWARNKINESAK